MTPGIHPSNVKMRLRKKLAMRPVMSTASGGNTTQKKYRSAFIISSPVTNHSSLLLQLVVFDHRIRQQIAAKTMQSRFKISVLPIDFDLHVFANPDASHFRHPKVSHRVANCVALRIEHSRLWHYDHFSLHQFTIFAAAHRTSAIPAPLAWGIWLLQKDNSEFTIAAEHVYTDVAFIMPREEKVNARTSDFQITNVHLRKEWRQKRL
jgi:hypothetical protein